MNASKPETIAACRAFKSNSPARMFGALYGAILDRLTHDVHSLEMNGERVRLRQSRTART